MQNATPPHHGNAGGHTWYGGNVPPQGFGPAQPGGWGVPPVQPINRSSNETLVAGLAHLSVYFAPLIAPLLIWLLVRDNMPYASRQGKQAFFFHLLFSVVSGVLAAIFFITFFFLGSFSLATASSDNTGGLPGVLLLYPVWFFLFFGVILLISLAGQIYSIYAAVQAFQGKPFSYPFLERL